MTCPFSLQEIVKKNMKLLIFIQKIHNMTNLLIVSFFMFLL